MRKIKSIALSLMILIGILTLALKSENIEGQNQNLEGNTDLKEEDHGCGSGRRVCTVNTKLKHR